MNKYELHCQQKTDNCSLCWHQNLCKLSQQDSYWVQNSHAVNYISKSKSLLSIFLISLEHNKKKKIGTHPAKHEIKS